MKLIQFGKEFKRRLPLFKRGWPPNLGKILIMGLFSSSLKIGNIWFLNFKKKGWGELDFGTKVCKRKRTYFTRPGLRKSIHNQDGKYLKMD